MSVSCSCSPASTTVCGWCSCCSWASLQLLLTALLQLSSTLTLDFGCTSRVALSPQREDCSGSFDLSPTPEQHIMICRSGDTALHWAAFHGHSAVVQQLLQAAADPVSCRAAFVVLTSYSMMSCPIQTHLVSPWNLKSIGCRADCTVLSAFGNASHRACCTSMQRGLSCGMAGQIYSGWCSAAPV